MAKTARPPAVPRRRADALRNVEAILHAATDALTRHADVSIGEIAREAGVGRATFYAHFTSRAEVVEAVVVRVLSHGKAVLDDVDLEGPAPDALARLVAASWELVDQARSVLAVAEKELSPERIRELHADPLARAEGLIRRGQEEGAFRSDLPASWLVATMHHVMHGAADEIAAGRLERPGAASVITRTLLGAFAPPATPAT